MWCATAHREVKGKLTVGVGFFLHHAGSGAETQVIMFGVKALPIEPSHWHWPALHFIKKKKKYSSWADLWQPDSTNPSSYLLLSSRWWSCWVYHLHWSLLPAPKACLPSCCLSTGVAKSSRLCSSSCSSSNLEDVELLLQLRWSIVWKTQCKLKRPKTNACYTDCTQLQPQCQSGLQNLNGFPLLTDPRPASGELSHCTNQNWKLIIWMFITLPSK